MNFIIDIGNTSAKIAVFENYKILENKIHYTLSKDIIVELQRKYPGIKRTIFSSVVDHHADLLPYLENNFSVFIELDQHTRVPVENRYTTCDTLGNDRIAAVTGANYLFPGKNILVIDIGTAITFDHINKKNQYIGGNISPGIDLRFRALNEHTDRLPLLSKRESFEIIGNSTESAIISGVQNGIIFEIQGYINTFESKYNDLQVVLTGGESFFFENRLKNNIFAEPNLVLIGLNRILEYNVRDI